MSRLLSFKMILHTFYRRFHLSEAASLPNVHLSGPDGDLQTQEPPLLQLKGYSDQLPDILRGHV